MFDTPKEAIRQNILYEDHNIDEDEADKWLREARDLFDRPDSDPPLRIDKGYLATNTDIPYHHALKVLSVMALLGEVDAQFVVQCPEDQSPWKSYESYEEIPDSFECDLCLEEHEVNEYAILIRFVG